MSHFQMFGIPSLSPIFLRFSDPDPDPLMLIRIHITGLHITSTISLQETPVEKTAGWIPTNITLEDLELMVYYMKNY